jgi:Na+/H+-translocating membrane pyrophosphatase
VRRPPTRSTQSATHQGGHQGLCDIPPVSVLFAAYNEDLKFFIANTAKKSMHFRACSTSLNNPYVVVGLLFGGLLPYLSARWA